jgi:hypothetical protein
MNKFDLWFPKPMEPGKENEAETAFVSGKSAYICLKNPFDDGSEQHDLVKSNGRILIFHEAVSADECCAQIDQLIDDLKSLKAKARHKFKD